MGSIYDRNMRLVQDKYNHPNEIARFLAPTERDCKIQEGIHAFYGDLMVQIPNGKSVLDMGCGTGLAIPAWEHASVGSYTGIDFSFGMIEIAKECYPCHNFIQGDIRRLDEYTNGPFDGWSCVNVMQYFNEPMLRKLVPRLRSVLAPGAVGFVMTWAIRGTGRQAFKTQSPHRDIAQAWKLDLLVKCFTEGGLFESIYPTFLDSSDNPALTATFRAI